MIKGMQYNIYDQIVYNFSKYTILSVHRWLFYAKNCIKIALFFIPQIFYNLKTQSNKNQI